MKSHVEYVTLLFKYYFLQILNKKRIRAAIQKRISYVLRNCIGINVVPEVLFIP